MVSLLRDRATRGDGDNEVSVQLPNRVEDCGAAWGPTRTVRGFSAVSLLSKAFDN